jgi:hypothetical protein
MLGCVAELQFYVLVKLDSCERGMKDENYSGRFSVVAFIFKY